LFLGELFYPPTHLNTYTHTCETTIHKHEQKTVTKNGIDATPKYWTKRYFLRFSCTITYYVQIS